MKIEENKDLKHLYDVVKNTGDNEALLTLITLKEVAISQSNKVGSMHNLLTEMCESFKEVFDWEDSRSYASPYLDYVKLRKTLSKAQKYLQNQNK